LINNYGIIIPQSSGTDAENLGHWDIVYNNDVVFHELGAMLNWSISNKIALWSSFNYKLYDIIDSDFADQLPYIPSLNFDVVFRALPGYGIEFMLSGQFISDQFTLPFEAGTGDDDHINAHFVSNLSLSKKIGEHVELYTQVNNLLNSEYEYWKGFVAPGIYGWGGIKIFW
jgi:outer membrane receptor protein involved in Fe transport